jgi:hypothetical protein
MSLEAVVPNLLFKNMEGSRFNNVTIATGTGHLQKGHGVSFADWDSDGDLDFFVEAGGAVPGDQAYNVLFQNPGNENHWLKVKVSGKASDRTSLGASIRAVVKGSDGDETSIFRTVGTNSSFGGNNLVELIGLGDATAVAELNVTWPATGTKQTYRNLAAGQFIEIIEGSDSYRRLFQPSIQPGPRPPAMQVRLDHTGSH